MSSQRTAVAVVTLFGAACAEGGTDVRRTTPDEGRDAGSLDAYPPEERHISLTLWPIYDVDDVLAATETNLPTSLDGVEVCVKSARPHAGAWEDFRETGRPCTVSVAGEPIVLDGVPPQSELIVTATKDGYWPSVFAVVTGNWSTDATRSAAPGAALRLLAKTSPWPGIEPPPSEGRGLLAVSALGYVSLNSAWLGGVAVSLAPGPSRGPFYGDGRTFDLAADRTLPGTLRTDPFASVLIWGNARPAPVALFVDVPEGDHVVHLEHLTAGCEVWGWFDGDTVYGYPGSLGEIRVPVLAGHWTPAALALCKCAGPDFLSLDPATCAPSAVSADSGQQ